MPPEGDAPAPDFQDTPDIEAPTSTPDQDTSQEQGHDADTTTDWEQKYSHLQPEYTRATQRLSEYDEVWSALQDPETRQAALEQLGWADEDESEFEPEDDEFEDPYEARLGALEQTLTERQQQEQQAAAYDKMIGHINDELSQIVDEVDHELSEDAIQVIGDLSQQMADEQGRPDVRGAYEAVYKRLLPAERQKWTSSKRAGRPGSGPSAASTPDLSNERDRVDYMAQRFEDVGA